MYKGSSVYKSSEEDKKNDITIKSKERNYIGICSGGNGKYVLILF